MARIFRQRLTPGLEARGLLPRRLYLLRALAALEKDDIDAAVRMVTLAAQKDRGRKWRLVCQQVIFRCRVLAENHRRKAEALVSEVAALATDADRRYRYEQLCQAERRARAILQRYESNLLKLLGEMPARVKSPPYP